MRRSLLILVSAGLVLCSAANGQMATLKAPPMAEAKVSAETQERVSSVKSRIDNMIRSGSVQRGLAELQLAVDNPKNTPDARSLLLAISAQFAERRSDPDGAAALYQQASTVQGAAPEVKAQACAALSALQARQRRFQEAAKALGAMLQIPDLPPDTRVVALLSRAGVYQAMRQSDDSYADCTAASQVKGASPRHRAVALLQRAGIPSKEPHWEEDIGLALAIPGIPADVRSAALLTRASYYRAARQKDKTLADCKTLLAMPDATPSDRAGALTFIAEDQLARYDYDAALHGLAEALAQQDLTPDTQATAYLTRCKVRMQQGDYARAYTDLKAAERTDHISPAVTQQIQQEKMLMDGQ